MTLSYDFRAFLAYWEERHEAFIDGLYQQLCRELPHYADLPREQLVGSIERKIGLWKQLLLDGDLEPMLARTRELVQQRVGANFPMMEMVRTSDLVRDHIWSLLYQFFAPSQLSTDVMEQLEQWVRQERDLILHAYGSELERIRVELHDRVQQLEQQQSLIRELSTPIVPVAEHVLVLPLVGHLDARRATQVLEYSLERIVATQSDLLIIDMTGVPVVDLDVAHNLTQLLRAVQMIGARSLLVGISADVARSLVQLQVDLGYTLIRPNLQEAIRYALDREP